MARQPFISKAARAAGITTEQGYLNWLAQQRGFKNYNVQRQVVQQRIEETGGTELPWNWKWINRVVKADYGKKPLPGYEKINPNLVQRLLKQVKQEFRQANRDPNRPHGPLARLLEHLGGRTKNADYRVGETNAQSVGS